MSLRRHHLYAITLATILTAAVLALFLHRQRRRYPPVTDPPAPAVTIRVLDVGQGDATYIHNGTSRVLIDGGPDPARLGELLDSLGITGSTLDMVVLTHAHLDHYAGLLALFDSRRNITVRTFIENQDESSAPLLTELRDSVLARVERGATTYRDSDDPCGDGGTTCIAPLAGGAHIELLRPMPGPAAANDRSLAIKLVAPDSASLTMWLAGDAEFAATEYFDRAGFAAHPGMRADVLKADHHGSCNGASARYLAAVAPTWIVVPVGAHNDYGHVHAQAKRAFTAAGARWLRTDRNGTVTIRSAGTAGSGYTITPSRPGLDLSAAGDRVSRQPECAGM